MHSAAQHGSAALSGKIGATMSQPTTSSEVPNGAPAKRGIGLIGLIALVISSSIGSGVFALSTDISAAAAPGAAIIAWIITGIGFIGLATTFGKLSLARPDLNGIVAYANEGFGPFVGFVSGWGYWLSIWIGNVAFGVMLVTAIGYFFPPFADGLTVPAVVFISVMNWAIILLVNHGVEEASVVNAIVMCCKLIPIFVFIVTMLFMFSFDVFTADFWGTLANNLGNDAAPGSLTTQIINCFMVMMWVFVGMEGAAVLGHRARRKADVSRATILGTSALVFIYVAASVLPYGYLTRDELLTMGSPSMVYIFQEAVGSWGGAFIAGGLVISILGAWLSYTILASEAMRTMADMELLPSGFAKLNAHGAPTLCLVVTGAMIQLLSIVMLFSEAAYQFAYSLCTASIVISWSLASAYMVKLARAREVEQACSALALSLFATVFLVVAVVLAGVDLLLLCCIAYIPGLVCYIAARREQHCNHILEGFEKPLAVVLVGLGVVAIVLVAMGIITI